MRGKTGDEPRRDGELMWLNIDLNRKHSSTNLLHNLYANGAVHSKTKKSIFTYIHIYIKYLFIIYLYLHLFKNLFRHQLVRSHNRS